MDTIPSLRLPDYAGVAATPPGDPNGPRAHFALRLRSALEEFGFVRIVDHCVSSDLVVEMYDACARFFALPDSEKRRCGGSPGGARGFTAFGIEHARDHSAPDLKEFFHVGREVASSDPLANRWPEAVPALARCGQRLFSALEECSHILLAALATAYDLPERTLADMVVGGNHVLRALHYPPIHSSERKVAAASLRAAPHEDINLITLLCGATEPGLEILRPDGQWMEVRAGKGEIVVDAGDMLARVTNGVIPATTHRVVNPIAQADCHRYSLPFFAHPRPECDLSVLDAFQSPERPPRTPPITAGEVLAERLREIGLS